MLRERTPNCRIDRSLLEAVAKTKGSSRESKELYSQDKDGKSTQLDHNKDG